MTHQGIVTPQARMDAAVQKSKELLSVLERLGKWQGPVTTLMETSVAISEVCSLSNCRSNDADNAQVHPYAKAVLATFNVVYRVSPLPSDIS